jgi:FKBP-type peptidyl-prolyl cis-trans isomerase SlpA
MGRVEVGSHVTLHYRLAAVVDGNEREVISTLAARPATLQVGAGQLADALERQLVGLEEGARAQFDFEAGVAFGPRNADLVQSIARSALATRAQRDDRLEIGDWIEIDAPDGGRLAGVLQQSGAGALVIDFNHPLAGLPVRFSVHIIGVL